MVAPCERLASLYLLVSPISVTCVCVSPLSSYIAFRFLLFVHVWLSVTALLAVMVLYWAAVVLAVMVLAVMVLYWDAVVQMQHYQICHHTSCP